MGGAVSVGAAQPQTPAIRTIVLHPMRETYLRINFQYDGKNALPPFMNEPKPAGKRLARILIPTSPPTPVLRNFTDDELYLQANHNQDFSSGSYTTYKSRHDNTGHVLFDGLQVCTEQGTLVIPYTIRMGTYKTVCTGWFEVQSGWSGSFDLDGQLWTLEIVDNLDGRIDDQDLLSLSTEKGTQKVLLTIECPVPRTLFFAGHTFRLDFAFKSLPPEVVLEAALTELRPALGQLDVQAAGCAHLRLRDGQQIVLLPYPAGTISLPVGNYQIDHCLLSSGSRGHPAPKFVSYDRRLSILPGQTTPVRLGAPLTNSVEVSRAGNLLHLKHQLTGVSGERYECRRDPASSYAIYKGPLKIAGGTFPFG
jgi:hypothetical protein